VPVYIRGVGIKIRVEAVDDGVCTEMTGKMGLVGFSVLEQGESS